MIESKGKEQGVHRPLGAEVERAAQTCPFC